MYAYYCLHKFHWTPSVFSNLSEREKAIIMAMIDERLEDEKKQKSKMRK